MATDLDGDPLTFRLLEGTAGLVMNDQGQISWTPTLKQISSQPYRLTVRVEDGQGGADDETYLIAVTKALVNAAPEITSTPKHSATTGYIYTYHPVATD